MLVEVIFREGELELMGIDGRLLCVRTDDWNKKRERRAPRTGVENRWPKGKGTDKLEA